MDTAISARAGVVGPLVGGSATVTTARVTHKTPNRGELMLAEGFSC